MTFFRSVPILFSVLFILFQGETSRAAELQIPGYYGGTVTIPDDTLPRAKVLSVEGSYNITTENDLDMTVEQEQERVIIDWDSFNIGKSASVHFDQQQSNWAALNRIYDSSPSQILGKLSADAQIYLINQNGILFGPDSQVNVRSLIASSLYLSDENFLNDTLSFGNVDEDPDDDFNYVFSETGVISNFGSITTEDQGSVYLIGPAVENFGSVFAPFGQIALVGGIDFELKHQNDKIEMTEDHTLYTDDNEELGTVLNGNEDGYTGILKTCSIDEDGNVLAGGGGYIGLFGRAVQHDGVIRSVTSLLSNGIIELRASDSIVTGANSLIEARINSSGEAFADTESSDTEEPFGAEVTFGGLTTGTTGANYTYRDSVEVIDHKGSIVAYSGTVNMYADLWIYLEDGSNIDVSGVWASRTGDSNEIEAQLNTVQLRDEYVQKGGTLQGKTVTFNALLGSDIGDTSGYLTSEEKTALEAATQGGEVNLWVGVDENDPQVNTEISDYESGDIVIAEGANIDFSGGGILYDGGTLETTKLLVGNKIYDISDSSSDLLYDLIITEQVFSNSKFGDTTFTGLYYGGAVPVSSYIGPYIQGSNAGSLSLIAPTVVLSGVLDGSVVNGIYQTETEDPTYEYDSTSVTAVGRAKAVSGTLTVGNNNTSTSLNLNYVTDTIVLTGQSQDLSDVVAMSEGTFVADLYNSNTSQITTETLANAQLGSVELYSNTSVTVDESASLQLDGDSSFAAHSTYIDIEGKVYAPGGEIELTLEDSYLYESDADAIDRLIYLGPNSVLSVAGERVDNSAAGTTGEADEVPAYTAGGSIVLSDETHYGLGVYTTEGSLIDVSGGYYIDQNGDLDGADAGTLSVQGRSILLDGELLGLSLSGQDGGTIELHASKVEVTAEDVAAGGALDLLSSTDILKSLLYEEEGISFGLLTLNQDRFTETGFSHISLLGKTDLTVDSGVTLTPSTVKMASPGLTIATYESPSLNTADDRVTVGLDELEETSITLKAGIIEGTYEDYYPTDGTDTLTLATGSRIEVAPGGTITLEGSSVDIDGTVNAPAGSIDLEQATYSYDSGARSSKPKSNIGQLTIRSNAQLLARGYNLEVQSSVDETQTEYSPLAGGTVSLSSWGTLDLQEGALIDVSAAEAVLRTVLVSGELTRVQEGADGGKIYLSYNQGDLDLTGKIRAGASLSGYAAGTLDVTRRSTANGIDLYQADIASYLAAGFDSLSFTSNASIYLADELNFNIPGTFSLDVPRIESAAGLSHSLQADWIQLSNSYYPTSGSSESGDASLSLLADWIDVEGSVVLSGFNDVTLYAENAISLSDAYYSQVSTSKLQVWEGLLETAGDLTLAAAVVYPTSESLFTVDVGETLSIEKSESSADLTVLSAGGKLTLQARSINHSGVLRAPMGQINLEADETLFVSSGSITSVKSDYYLLYGENDTADGTYIAWIAETESYKESINDDPSGSYEPSTVTEPLESGVTMTAGNEETEGIVVVQPGAQIDISGGGGIIRSYFLPGTGGTVDPLDDEYFPDRYVIVPGIDVIVPGAETSGLMIELDGSELLEAGIYYVLPDEYAYLPGAIIVEATGQEVVSTNLTASITGEYATSGNIYQYGSEATGIKQAFTLTSAADLLGDVYTTEQITAGNAGTLSIEGNTVLLDGTISAEALAGYSSGTFSLTAGNIDLTSNETTIYSDLMSFESVQDDVTELELNGRADISAESLSNSGMEKIYLSAKGSGENSVRVRSGAEVRVSNISLEAEDEIAIEDNALVEATASDGEVSLKAELVSLGQESTVAGPIVSLDTNTLDLDGGEFLSDAGTLNVTSDVLHLVGDGYVIPTEGVYLTESLSGFNGFSSVYLQSRSDLIFVDGVDLSGLETLSIDAARLIAESGNVNLSASQVVLQNSEGVTAGDFTSSVTGAGLTVEADQIQIGPGYVETDTDGHEIIRALEIDDGFETINLTSRGDLVFAGQTRLDAEGTGRMTLQADRVIATYYRDAETDTFTNGRAVINAAGRDLSFEDANPTEVTDNSDILSAGSTLDVTAETITNNTSIVAKAGLVTMSAADGIDISGSIDVSGVLIAGTVNDETYSETYDAGKIVLESAEGNIELQDGSLLDVSAGDAENAGEIVLDAAQGTVAMNGVLSGAANGGNGGSFGVNSGEALDLDDLTSLLMSGGFTNAITIETHAGNLLLSTDSVLTASSTVLSADGGALTVAGTIETGDENAGWIELWADGDLTVTGTLAAAGAEEGGTIKLSSENGKIVLGSAIETATIDTKGEDSTTGGEVYIRARSDGADDGDAEHFEIVSATVNADDVRVEGFTKDERTDAESSVTADDVSTLIDLADNDADDILAEFSSVDDDDTLVTFVPGAEITSTGALIVDSTISLNAANTGTDAGALTLRAAGDVAVERSIISTPASTAPPAVDTELIEYASSTYRALNDSWNITLVAGADLTSADLAQTQSGTGDLTMEAGTLIYTEKGDVALAAGDDIVLDESAEYSYMARTAMSYSVGTYDGNIQISAGSDLDLQSGAAIQSAVGDISVDVGGNLFLGSEGAIRSVGSPILPEGFDENFIFFLVAANFRELYGDGGDISLSVDGSVVGEMNDDRWYEEHDASSSIGSYGDYVDFVKWDENDTAYTHFLLAEQSGASGIISSGGGDITARVYGDFTAQAGSFYWFQEGSDERSNLTLLVGGDLDGRFHVYDGIGTLKAGGNFGLSLENDDADGLVDQVLEAFDTQYYLTAQGDVLLGSVVNPTLDNGDLNLRYMSYSQQASIVTTSLFGDVVISGENDLASYAESSYTNILPATFVVQSGRDINLEDSFVLMPAADGTMTLIAKGSIDGRNENDSASKLTMLGSLTVSAGERGIQNYYGSWANMSTYYDDLAAVSGALAETGDLLLHSNDTVPVIVSAGEDISYLQLEVPKKIEINAGRDIEDLSLFAQNVGASGTDVTKVRAGRNLVFYPSSTETGIVVAGDGSLVIQVGDTLDLGTSETGIQTVSQNYESNKYNYALGDGSDLIILVGADRDLTVEEVESFFSALRSAAEEYSIALADGDDAAAAEIAAKAREEIIDPLFEGVETREGTVEMALSTIQTKGADSDIYLISTGGVTVGQSAFDDSTDTGILTEDTTEIEVVRDENGNVVVDEDGYVQYNILEIVRDENGEVVLDENGNAQYKLTNGGSDINIFAVNDIDVLESRIMTKFGSDIVIWCDQGNVNAGRGSTTALSAGTPVFDEDNNTIGFNAPALGSGIRALSYDRDGEDGSDPAPVAGDIYVAVPQGILDAGEAGIRGNSVILGATKVLNAQNISFSSGSVGVPTAGNVSTLGTLGGSNTANEVAKIADEVATLGDKGITEDVALVDDFIAKWIEAQVIGYPDQF